MRMRLHGQRRGVGVGMPMTMHVAVKLTMTVCVHVRPQRVLLLLLLQWQLLLRLLLQLMWLRGRVKCSRGAQIEYCVRRMQVLLGGHPPAIAMRRLVVQRVRPVDVLLLGRQR